MQYPFTNLLTDHCGLIWMYARTQIFVRGLVLGIG
jgi:hypothetical protein